MNFITQINIKSKLTAHWQKLLLITLLAFSYIGVVVLLHTWRGIPIPELTRDVNAIANIPIYTGFFSQLGIFFWAPTAALCFFTYRILSSTGVPKKQMFFFLFAALLSLLLGLDDVFLLHEQFFPRVIGISERFVFLIYGLFTISFLILFRYLILKTPYIILLVAFMGFGLSIVSDIVHDFGFLFEDGAKMFGLVSWFMYFYSTSTNAIMNWGKTHTTKVIHD